jgi:hypothetical protein
LFGSFAAFHPLVDRLDEVLPDFGVEFFFSASPPAKEFHVSRSCLMAFGFLRFYSRQSAVSGPTFVARRAGR